jgi:hypothetical protein
MRRGLAKIGIGVGAIVGVAVGAGLLLGGRDFVAQHYGALCAAAFTVAGVLLLGARLVAGAARGAVLAVRQPRALGQSGAAAAEFIIVVIPFLLMLFALMQMSLASLGRVLTSYSAFCAVRAAIVVVPGNYGNEGPGQIGQGGDQMSDFGSSGKMGMVRAAAAYPLIAASPAIDTVLLDIVERYPDYLAQRVADGWVPFSNPGSGLLGTVENTINTTLQGGMAGWAAPLNGAIGGALGALGIQEKGYAVDRALDAGWGADTDGPGGAILRSLRKLIYARMMTVVTLYDDKGNVKSHFGWNDPIRARVTYMFYCQIPLANRFAGSRWYKVPQSTLDQVATGAMGSTMTGLGIPGFFLPLSAEHTMVNQGRPNG